MFSEEMNERRGMPTAAWYKKVMTREFDPTKVVFLIFADRK